MFWSWLFPPRRKAPDATPDAGEASIPDLSVGVVDGMPAAPVVTPATSSTPTDAGAAAAVGAAFLLGAELALHGQPQNDPGHTASHDPGPTGLHPAAPSSPTHSGVHMGNHGDAGPGAGGPGDAGSSDGGDGGGPGG